MKELEKYRKIMTNLPEGIREAEAEAEKNDRMIAGMVNGKETGLSASDRTAVFVRASGNKTGMTYTQNLEADPREVLLEAYRNSEFVQEEQPERLNGPAKDVFGQDIEHVTFEILLKKAAELEKKIKEEVPDASHLSVMVSENLKTTGIVNSLGLDKTCTVRIAEASLSLTCENGIHRSLELETSAHSVEELEDEYFIRKVKEWSGLPEQKALLCPGSMPAVINGCVMCNILLTAWQMFSGYHYLNKSTPFYGKLGEKLFPDILNISDIQEDAIAGYGRKFDCEGSTSQRVDIIKEGKLQALMHNLTTASKLGSDYAGNAGRDVSLMADQTECKVIPTNFTLLSGSQKKEELLADLQNGIYIYESFDMFHSVNTASGDFSIPCQGVIYRNGKPIGRVEGITMNGNLVQLLRNIKKIADDRTTVSMIMSKSLAITAPSIYVSDLLVSGGQGDN